MTVSTFEDQQLWSKIESDRSLQGDLMRSGRFRVEREPGWQRLDELVKRAEQSGVSKLSYEEVRELSQGYREAMNSLSVAREISLDKALVDYLESLCLRGYLVVYAPQETLRGVTSRLMIYGIPQAVRRSLVPLMFGFLVLAIGCFVGFYLFLADQNWFYTFVPPALADMRTPEASGDYLRSTIYDVSGNTTERLFVFSSELFTHNTTLIIFIFALGIFASIFSVALTFYNGLLLGAFFGLFYKKDLGFDIFAWLSIHGVVELAAVAIACAAAIRLGTAILLPGNLSRSDALRAQSHDAVKLALLAGILLVVAAFIEGFLRQLIQDPIWRLVIGWGTGLGFLLWLCFSGREAAPVQESLR